MPAYNSISDIFQLFQHVEVSYYPEIVNNIENIERYMNNELLTAANIGVYIADLAYAYSTGSENAAIPSYFAAMELSQNIQLAMTFLVVFLENYSVTEAELDTILLKLEQDLQTSAAYLTGEEEVRLYSALLTGTYIEKVFLLYSIISKYSENSVPENEIIENIQRLIWIASGQKKALEKLNQVIDGYEIPEEYQLYHYELSNLEKQMNETPFLMDTSIVRTVEIPGSPEFVNLYNEIIRIRKFITEPELVGK